MGKAIDMARELGIPVSEARRRRKEENRQAWAEANQRVKEGRVVRPSLNSGYAVGAERRARQEANRLQLKAESAIRSIMLLLEAGGWPVNEDGETREREALVLALWELEKRLYGKKQTAVDLELKWYKRVKRTVAKMSLTRS